MRFKNLGLLFLFILLPAAWACSNSDEKSDAGINDIDGGPLGENCHQPNTQNPPALPPLPVNPRFGVVLSDYTSAAISVLDTNGEIIDERWVHSGTTLPGLVAALSGDLDLPTFSQCGSLTILDRFRTDVVSRFELPTGRLIGQVRTHEPNMESGFASNPQDIVFMSPELAWVSRLAPNLDMDANPLNAGTDLLEINPTTMARTQNRIDLSALNAPSTRGPEQPTFAGPSRMARVGSVLVVGLFRQSVNFQSAASGMVAIVDSEARAFRGFDIPGMSNCFRARSIPGETNKVLVGCQGFANPFGDETQLRASSGFVILEVSGFDEVSIVATWRTSENPTAVLAVENVLPLSSQLMVAIAPGVFGGVPAEAYLVDMNTGSQQLVYRANNAFDLGFPAFDSDTGVLLIPDAATGLRRFRLSGAQLMDDGAINVGIDLGLPPRSVHRL
jgi:hypothetical protein